jgi:hypothetical protein
LSKVKGRRKRRRTGILLFLIPLFVVALAVTYQEIAANLYQTGTLVVRAQSSDRYYHSVGLNVSASVGARSGITPFNLSLTQGTYTVSYEASQWYHSPQPRSVGVIGGKTSYAIGVYDPIVEAVAISQDRFNTTQLTVMHGATPVVWLNQMGGYAVIESGPTGRVIIPPSQNFTFVFPAAGSFAVSMPVVQGAPELTILSA